MAIKKNAELNLLWGYLILEELARLGVQHVCLAPGSRSTPLTLAAAKQTKLKKHLHFDERGLGFFALGLAKASATPVVIITTSGTAVANLYPAVIEAWLTDVPLVILSADRPLELIDCGANQAIHQPAIFAGYAKSINLPTPDINIHPKALLTTLDEALANRSKPIHINCRYREPLYPENLDIDFSQHTSNLDSWQYSDAPYTHYAKIINLNTPTTDTLVDFVDGKGVIVAGSLTPQQQPQLIVELAQKLGWPLLTDAQSQLRQHGSAITNIDQLLLQPKAKALLKQADRVLVFGGRLLSKRLLDYLSNQKWHQYWQVLSEQGRLDPDHTMKCIWPLSLRQFISLPWPHSTKANWALDLVELNEQLVTLFKRHIDAAEFGEAQVVRAIASVGKQRLFVGNSLPVRLYDMYAPINKNEVNLYTNRGASGIDGLLATACGIATHGEQVTTLIIGDLSQLYDLNSFAIAANHTTPLVIVIINNDGAGIFNLLPIPDEKLKEDYYQFPHGFQFGHVAAMFDLSYAQSGDIDSFNDAYCDAITRRGASVIEVNLAQDQASTQIERIADWIKQS